MLANPCKQHCPDRQIGCHGKCERYLRYAEVVAAARERRMKFKEEEYALYGKRRRH